MVANKFLEDTDIQDAIRAETVAMCRHFHMSIQQLSDKLVTYNHYNITL